MTPTLLPTGLDVETLHDLHAALRILQRLALHDGPPTLHPRCRRVRPAAS